MNRSDAEEVNKMVYEIFDKVNHILFVINNSYEIPLRKDARRAIGKVIAELGLEILEPIYKQFPDLRLPELEE